MRISYVRALFGFLLVTGLVAIDARSSFGEIYRCGNTWSNVPCRRRGSSIRSATPSSDPNQDKIQGIPTLDCSPTVQGVDIRIERISAETGFEGGSPVIRFLGTVRNFSRKSLAGPLHMKIAGIGKKTRSYFISGGLASSGIMNFRINHYGESAERFSVLLSYAPALSCKPVIVAMHQEGLK